MMPAPFTLGEVREVKQGFIDLRFKLPWRKTPALGDSLRSLEPPLFLVDIFQKEEIYATVRGSTNNEARERAKHIMIGLTYRPDHHWNGDHDHV